MIIIKQNMIQFYMKSMKKNFLIMVKQNKNKF